MPVIRIIRTVALAGLVAMVLAMTYAWRNGDFVANATAIIGLPWGVVSLLDAYIGFALVGGWIVFRESQAVVGALWLASILVVGNLATCIYVLIASFRAQGDLRRFWLGARAEALRTS